MHEFATLPSTNLIAGALRPGHAVRADVQTGGRDAPVASGSPTLAALVLRRAPRTRPAQKWSILPLGAGWAVIDALREIGITGLRLRWPNDILAGRRKLAGLLVEQYQPETAVIGVGINIANRPDSSKPASSGHTIGVEELAGRRHTSTKSPAPLVLSDGYRI
ncbi:MAG: hypothetical protein IPP19_15920 [Verrucomicrobia bacterium]|nr:hypothetical protein [Verrucomicrobiota bacterium]